MEKQPYRGVDWHKASLQACAIDEAGARLWEGRWPRTAEGMAAWAARGVRGAQVAVEATGPTGGLGRGAPEVGRARRCRRSPPDEAPSGLSGEDG